MGTRINVLGKKVVCVMLTILPTECQSAIKKKWVASTMYSVHTERILYNWSSVNFEFRLKFSNSDGKTKHGQQTSQPTTTLANKLGSQGKTGRSTNLVLLTNERKRDCVCVRHNHCINYLMAAKIYNLNQHKI